MIRRSLPGSRRLAVLPHGNDRTATSTLQHELENALARACSERDLGVAEHLLRALEEIASRTKNDEVLDATYLVLARQLTVGDAGHQLE